MRFASPTLLVLLFLVSVQVSPSTYGVPPGNEGGDIILSKLSVSLLHAGIEVRDGVLVHELCDRDPLPVLLHVDEGKRGALRPRLVEMGVRMGYRFTSLEVYEAWAPLDVMPRLTLLDEVTYIEWNAPGTFDTEISTAAIMAPRVWSSVIRDGSSVKEGIRGRGIGIAVVDSGIDAGHPDLDYGFKTVKNIKAVRAGDPWVEMENTDTSVGHGSHCAGISAGNGDASAGGRSGVAPEANLIGLSLTEGDEEVSTSNYLYGLEWVFENSRPHANPYNIKVCTNSWHTTVGEYDPEMALSKIINRLTYENNVVCTFSAGNDGRQDPEGTVVWTSQQGNTPSAVMVAAYARDGSYVAEFTSHGQVGLNHTYPDVGAPGVRIWSAHARRTGISAGSKLSGNPNPYYLAISGTSMSTPHVAGTVALLWEACPSMGISGWEEDYNGSDPEWFHSHEFRFVHDAELILEASATPIPFREGSGDSTGVFVDDPSVGWGGREIDYAQGYGFIDVEKAVGIALTLQELRSRFLDRYVDVFTALKVYEGAMDLNLSVASSTLMTSWEGEYSRFNDQNGKPLVVQNQTKLVYVPEGVGSMSITLEYDALSLPDMYVGGLTVDVDTDGDGQADFSGGPPLAPGTRTFRIPVSGTDVFYRVMIRGQGIKVIRPVRETSYVELRIPYSITVEMELDTQGAEVPREAYSSAMGAFIIGDGRESPVNSTLGIRVYDLGGIGDPFGEEGYRERGEAPSSLLLIILLTAAVTLLSIYGYHRIRKRNRKGGES